MPKSWKEVKGLGQKIKGRNDFDLNERMFTTTEVEKILRTTKFGLDAMCSRGRLRYLKVGRMRLFPESWLKEDMLKRAKGGCEEQGQRNKH